MNSQSGDHSPGLREFMQHEEQREVECQAYLERANALLAPPMSRVIQTVREQVAMAGRSDYFFICEVAEIELRRRLILWEAKAPQLPPFEVITQNRLIPTRALVEAENQLLYYFDEYRSNGQLLDRYRIRHPNDVRLGGIIIGRDDNLVRPKASIELSQEALRQMAWSAIRIRNEHFYRDQIRILTWDRIADVVLAPAPGQIPNAITV